MMNIKRCILKVRLFLSTLYMRPHKEEKGFIFEINDDEFKELPTEEQAKEVQKNWNKHMREK